MFHHIIELLWIIAVHEAVIQIERECVSQAHSLADSINQ
jgi:hypothetical protein